MSRAKRRNTDYSDWRTIENEREKYAAYLCSREWGVLKEAVHKRSGGRCERCRVLPGNAVHHLTYERKYCEDLEDLQHNCHACHDFTHGKSEFDPEFNHEWTQYVRHCIAFPRTIIQAEWIKRLECYEFMDPEFVVHLAKIDKLAYSIVLLDERRMSRLPRGVTYYEDDPDDGNGFVAEWECEGPWELAMSTLQFASDLPFDFDFWLRRAKPSINPKLYDESIRQVAKCVSVNKKQR